MLPIASTALETGQFETARRLYRRVLAVDEDSTAARMGLGDVAFAEQEPAIAARWYRSAVNRADEPEERHSALLAHGRAAVAAGELDEARESFTALTQGTRLEAVREGLSALMRREGKDLNGQGVSKTNLAWAHNGIGLTLLLQGDVPSAVAEMERAVELAPEEERLQANLDRARAALDDLPPVAEPAAPGEAADVEPTQAAEAGEPEPAGELIEVVDGLDEPAAAVESVGPVEPPQVAGAGEPGPAVELVEAIDRLDEPAEPLALVGAEGGIGDPPEPLDNAFGPEKVADSAEPGEVAEPVEPPQVAGTGEPDPAIELVEAIDGLDEPAEPDEVAEPVEPPQVAGTGEPDPAIELVEAIDGLDELDAGSPEASETPLVSAPLADAGDGSEDGPEDSLPGSSATDADPFAPLSEPAILVTEIGGAFLEFGAFAEFVRADAMAARLRALTDHSVAILGAPSPDDSPSWQVRIGPIILRETMLNLFGVLDAAGYEVVNVPALNGNSGLLTGVANWPLETMVVHENDARFLQVGAYGNRVTAESLAAELRNLTDRGVSILKTDPGKGPLLHRVRLGPLEPDDPLIDSH
ncbi:MAG: tetratricopeptide repeat protein [Gammaproteobacteria bacterium]|nr:tetratricopeptide repeat protein [Gammaproteobacteria bacterium]